MPHLSLDPAALAAIAQRLAAANRGLLADYPGDSTERQPVHTVYGGAQLFGADRSQRLGQLALASLDSYAPDFVTFAGALGLVAAAALPQTAGAQAELEAQLLEQPDRVRHDQPQAWLAATVYARVREKLRREPVEDQRVDFEDGYGYRPDAEEDQHALAAGKQLAVGLAAGTLPPYVGIRLKAFAPESFGRAARTLDLLVSELARRSGGALPPHFVVTLPKVTLPEQVAALAELLGQLEAHHGLAPGIIKIDLMIESAQAVVNAHGQNAIRSLVAAGEHRVMSIAFGTYDYTASCNITARYQTHDHPAADFARQAIGAALAGSGVWLSDGVTTAMPIGPHRATAAQPLSSAQRDENRAVVFDAWKIHYENIRRSLRQGFYQSWDLHPAQLPVRYAAVHAFFLEQLDDAAGRLRAFIERAGQATRAGSQFDDAATGQGLLNFFLRGIACGALAEQEALAAGVTLAELRGRSFARIVANRTV